MPTKMKREGGSVKETGEPRALDCEFCQSEGDAGIHRGNAFRVFPHRNVKEKHQEIIRAVIIDPPAAASLLFPAAPAMSAASDVVPSHRPASTGGRSLRLFHRPGESSGHTRPGRRRSSYDRADTQR